MRNKAASLKVRAERKGGELLAKMPKKHGARPADTGSHDVTPQLSDIGIGKMQSSRWQMIATVPETTNGGSKKHCLYVETIQTKGAK